MRYVLGKGLKNTQKIKEEKVKMSIRRRINRIISCFLTSAMVLTCMGNVTPAFAAATAYDVSTISSGEATTSLYSQDFEAVTDVTTMAESQYAADALSIANDTAHGNYFSYDLASLKPSGGRGARLDMSVDVSKLSAYIVEFDAAMRPANGGASAFAVMSTGFTYADGKTAATSMNSGVGNGYLIKLYNDAANDTEYTLEGAGSVTIASESWCNYKLYVDTVKGQVSVTITGADGTVIADKKIVSYDGDGSFAGFYMNNGRYNGATMIDNVVVREVASDDEFGDISNVTVTFDVNGHGDAIASAEIVKGSCATAPAAPLASGYVFRGWYAEAACETAWDFTTAVTTDITLYAKWTEEPAFDTTGALYSQDFSGIADAGTVATSTNAQAGITLGTDDAHGYYLSYAISGQSGSRGAYMDFKGLDVSALNKYTVEFDAALTPGNDKVSEFAVKGADFAYVSNGINNGADSGYILKLANAEKNGVVYNVNGTETTVTIPSGEWCHYVLTVDKAAGEVSVTITGVTTGIIAEELTVAYNGTGDVSGMYMLIGRYAGTNLIDNILVNEVAEKVTVTFDMNGQGTAIDAVEVTAGEAVTEPTAPTAEGYTFGGWYTDADCTTAYDFAAAVTADITLYAKWTQDEVEDLKDPVDTATWTFGEEYISVKEFDTKTLDKTAIGATGFDIALTTSVLNYNNAIVRNNSSENKGYYPYTHPEANGYYLFTGAGGNGGTVTATLTLPGVVPAGKEIKITFVKISGTNDGKKNRGAANNANTITVGSTVLDLQNDYNFNVWTTKSIVTDSKVSAITIDLGPWSSVGIAKIEVADPVVAETVKVTFDMNGQGTAIDAVEVTKGEAVTAPAAPKAEGYTFGGWYTDADCTTAYDFTAAVTADITLYAKWTQEIIDDTEDPVDALYYQNFTSETDVTTVATSQYAGDALKLLTDSTYGKYLSFDLSELRPSGSRDAHMNFADLDVSAMDVYIVEFDAAIVSANDRENQFAVKGTDFAATVNSSANSGYLLKLANGEKNSVKYKVNDTDTTVTIPSGEWCHYKLYVDKTFGMVSLTITGSATGTIAEELIVSSNGTGNVAGLYMLGGRYNGAFSVDNIIVREVTADDEVEIKSGTEYSVVMDATGDTTAVDTSALITNGNVIGYMVTTSKDGVLVSQNIVTNAPTSVDTTGADKLEVAVVLYYTIGAPGELGNGGYNIAVPSGNYNFKVYNTSGGRTDVYVNDQMLVNNLCQNGSTPNYYEVKDIVVTGDNAKISTTDSSGTPNIQVQIIKSPSIVNRAKKVFVLGDSLVAVYYNGASASNNIRTGWGQVLADYLTDDVDVVDLANSGVTAIGLYTTAFSQIKGSGQAGDILVLESGYNDRNYSSEEEMKTAVTNMVNEASALGVEVILVSPNASAHDYKESVVWTSYMADVATATGAKYIDLSKLSYDFLFKTYASNTAAVNENFNLPGDGDTLHSSYNGANKWASVVAGAMYELGYTSIVDTEYVYSFVDTVGNLISCNALGKTAEGYVKVTYDMNGVNTANRYLIVAEGSTLSRPSTPVASGWAFEGWYKDKECTTAWDFTNDVVTGETVIYAKWVENSAGIWYVQDFADVTDAATVATSTNAQEQLSISSDDAYSNFLLYDFSSTSTNSRGAYVDFKGLSVEDQDKYIVEFDASIIPGNNQGTYFTVKGTDFEYIDGQINYGAGSGYIINIENSATKSDVYVLNGTQTVTIPKGEWCHYKIYVDKTLGLVSTTITGVTSGVVFDNVVTAYNGEGNVSGLYMLAGRYNPVIAIDNIFVRGIGEYDEFGEIIEETLAGAEFTSELNTVITQPEEGSAVHLPITIKGNGSLAGDLSDKVTVEWSVVGLENEDGYISLTKAEGTGAGTDGEAPDGTKAYFNVRNGVSNYFGYVQAVVSYGEDSYTITTPFAVVGATGVDNNQLAPVAGYPVCMDDYADSLINYVGIANGLKDKDIVLNNWSIYGSNGSRSMQLVKTNDGKKAIEFASNGGSGSTVAVYQWTDQTSQYVIDFTAKFTADMAFGVYYNTPNNTDNNPEWTASFGSGALTLGTESISGINANEWYRVVVTADASIQKASMIVYDAAGNKLGEINDIDMANNDSVQKYFCFMGTWPMYLNSFKAYKPTLSSMTVGSDSSVVKVPENGEAVATVDLSAVMTSKEGVKMTGAVDWSLAEEYTNVEIVATGAQTATLTISEGASGTIIVVATKDGVQAECTIQLTTSSNVVSFTQSASSITIPFAGEEDFVANYSAVTRDGSGAVIDGGAITYALLAKDGVTETTVKGVTFENGVLTVSAGASPAVVYVKATNAEGLSAKVKVNIHGLSFAFGSGEMAEGFTQVADTLYTEKLGYGFAKLDGLVINADSVTGTADFRFKATVPNGNYVVTINTTAASVTSEVVESVAAVTGITKEGNTFSVAVCDGVLDLTFPANAAVTSIEISQAAAKTALEKPMIYAIGDSTTKNNASGALSWGNCVTDGKVIVPSTFSGFANHGMAGRDSVNYYNQGRVEAVLLSICPGDYVTVNMGINSKETGEAAAYLTLLSEYYIEGILQRGGIPVIVTATPDGPVGNSLASNYNSETGMFTNNRGDGARNDVLRWIAQEKNIAIIELGQWGQDWMNTLTASDVTAYNAENGTSYKTVLEMVQSWYVDHNHYKEYLGIKIGEYIIDQLKAMEVDETSVIYDFQNEISTNWFMTGDLSAGITIVDDSEVEGNKYLQFTAKEARNTTTKKAFANMPDMVDASIDFEWYFGGQVSTNRAGYTGIVFTDNGLEILSLYFGEMRNTGDTSSVYYSINGINARIDSGVKVASGSWADISVYFDFENGTATIYVGGTQAATVEISSVIQKVDGLSFVTCDLDGSTKITPTMGIDNMVISYIEKTVESDESDESGKGTVEYDTDNKDILEYIDELHRKKVEKRWKGKAGWQMVYNEWYYFNAKGSLVVGWVQDTDGRWYYMNNNGSMATGWVLSETSGRWYYMDLKNGHMLSDQWLCDPDSGIWYYLGADGAMCTGWNFIDNTWYYLDANGAMCTGWNNIDGKIYLFGTNGAMLTGWQTVRGKHYYMLESGECLINTTTPDGHKVDENGARID